MAGTLRQVALHAHVTRPSVGVLQGLGEQGFAGLEVIVDVGGGDAGLHGDAGDADAVDALAGDLADGRGQDPIAPIAPGRHQLGAPARIAGARSARIRSANHATPFSRADRGPQR